MVPESIGEKPETVLRQFLTLVSAGAYADCARMIFPEGLEPYKNSVLLAEQTLKRAGRSGSFTEHVEGAKSMQSVARMAPSEVAARLLCHFLRLNADQILHTARCGPLVKKSDHYELEFDWEWSAGAVPQRGKDSFPLRTHGGRWTVYAHRYLDAYLANIRKDLQQLESSSSKAVSWMSGYRVSGFLKKVKTMESELGAMYLTLSSEREWCTPLDAIPFAGVGNGDSFCFLTDFARHRQLQEMPIIYACHDGDPPVKLVAENFREFIALCATTRIPEELYRIETHPTEIAWRRNIAKVWLGEKTFEKSNRQAIARLAMVFKVKPIKSVYTYIQGVRRQRVATLACTTADGLGVPKPLAGWNQKVRKFDFFQKYTPVSSDQLHAFLRSASAVEKMVFFRDYQFHFAGWHGEWEQESDVVACAMDRMGLKHEQANLRMLALRQRQAA
jgi:hypothetical protein